MKSTLLFAISFMMLAATAHAQIGGKAIPEYKTRMGTTFHPGDTLRLGLGTDLRGSFKYITIPANIFISPIPTPLSAVAANQRTVIKEIRLQTFNKRVGPRTVAVVNFGGFNDAVDLESAEEAGEIRTVNNRPKATAAAPASVSVADELIKLKGLLDANAITQAEYDAQKAKLLK